MMLQFPGAFVFILAFVGTSLSARPEAIQSLDDKNLDTKSKLVNNKDIIMETLNGEPPLHLMAQLYNTGLKRTPPHQGFIPVRGRKRSGQGQRDELLPSSLIDYLFQKGQGHYKQMGLDDDRDFISEKNEVDPVKFTFSGQKRTPTRGFSAVRGKRMYYHDVSPFLTEKRTPPSGLSFNRGRKRSFMTEKRNPLGGHNQNSVDEGYSDDILEELQQILSGKLSDSKHFKASRPSSKFRGNEYK